MSADRKYLSVAARAAARRPDQGDLEAAVYSALAGWVHMKAEVSLAEEITLRTKGVRKVHNELSPDL